MNHRRLGSRLVLGSALLLSCISCRSVWRDEQPPWTDQRWDSARVTSTDGSRIVLSSAHVEQHGSDAVVVGTRARTKTGREELPLERVTRIESKVRPADADAPPAYKVLNAIGLLTIPALVVIGVAAAF